MSNAEHTFGNINLWTQEKLNKVQNYLQTYATALKNQNFRTIYIDAFAGSGYVYAKEDNSLQPFLLEFSQEEVKGFTSGSARNALEVVPPFDQYVFIEKNKKRFDRFLRKDGNISEDEKKILDEMFGTDEWFQEFFKEKEQRGLFETQPKIEKIANFDSIANYFNKRLDSVFAGVAKNPLKLYNSKNIPLYLLCFAVGNPSPKAKGLALKFADYILQMK